MALSGVEITRHLVSRGEQNETPRSIQDWEGPTAEWPCHCCNRVNGRRTKRCRTCGRSAAYFPSVHLPFFGNMAKAMRPEQAIFLVDQRGFDVNATDSENWTPIHLACAYGNIGLLEVLVDRGALFEAQTRGGWRPLHLAAHEGHLACVELLLSKRAKSSCHTKHCRSTPLHVAAVAGSGDVCKCLVEGGADLEARDMMERTPLHLGADRGYLEVVQALVDAGAKTDVEDHDRWIPRQAAEFRGFMDVATVLANSDCVRQGVEGVTRGASDALPAAPWHVEIFAQVRKSAARARKLEAVAAAREEMYSKYASIYKHHAAKNYARSIEASRKGKGKMAAYRQRIVCASTDWQRYRGYAEHLSAPAGVQINEECDSMTSAEGEGVFLPSLDSDSISKGSEKMVEENGDLQIGSNTSALEGGGETSSRCSGGHSVGELPEALSGPGVADFVVRTDSGGQVTGREGGGDAAGNYGYKDTFVDVVPFNNVRAKYLRPWEDDGLSRPYHVVPAADWKAERSSSVPRTGDSMSTRDSFTTPMTVGIAAAVDDYRKSTERPARRGSYVLSRKAEKAWGYA